MPEFTESIENPLTDKDREDLDKLMGEHPEVDYHPVLKVWMEVLKPEVRESRKGITVQWATMICGKYPQMTYAQVPAFHDRYFELLDEIYAELAEIVAADEDCLKYTTREEDLEFNSGHYKELLLQWQIVLLNAELSWDPRLEEAAADVAAMGEVYTFLFGERGLTGHLEAIQLDFTDADQEELRAALEAHKAEFGEEK